MQHFIGTYECKADEKGRIMLPVSLKKQLSDKLKNGFVIKRGSIQFLFRVVSIKGVG
jgi:MraZ protein